MPKCNWFSENSKASSERWCFFFLGNKAKFIQTGIPVIYCAITTAEFSENRYPQGDLLQKVSLKLRLQVSLKSYLCFLSALQGRNLFVCNLTQFPYACFLKHHWNSTRITKVTREVEIGHSPSTGHRTMQMLSTLHWHHSFQ